MSDLSLLFALPSIKMDEIESIMQQIKSEEVRTYIQNLRTAKPESALREAFFAGPYAVLSKFIAEEMIPESAIGTDYIDYRIGSENKFILLELKSFLDRELTISKDSKMIIQKPLRTEDHQEQILKYIKKGGEFVIITNLKDWFFFNDNVSPDSCKPFYSVSLEKFVKELQMGIDLLDYLRRRESETLKENLDQRFFESLKSWVTELSKASFAADHIRKTEIVIGIINRFIFIQTLEDYDVIDYRSIKKSWDDNLRRWSPKGDLFVLEKFFGYINEWFYLYYDTELFLENPLNYLEKNPDNIEIFIESLKLVLGVLFWQTELGGYRGIMQYKFSY